MKKHTHIPKTVKFKLIHPKNFNLLNLLLSKTIEEKEVKVLEN